MFKKLKESLSLTRENLTKKLGTIFSSKKTIDPNFLKDLETNLILADVGAKLTADILAKFSNKMRSQPNLTNEDLLKLIKAELMAALQPAARPFALSSTQKPTTILMVGVNGTGKTTTIGKLAHFFKQQNKKVILGAADTFRAAAIEQLKKWAERNRVPIIAEQTGADSASVAFDSYNAAQARGADILIIDTAGRLHTQNNLMQELKKVKKVLGKIDPTSPHETLLVLDATIGQNALNQAREFHQTIGLTGIILTKLDGTAKGGIIFAIVNELNLPIYFIGTGEGIEDLEPFNAEGFVEALFPEQ